MRKKNLTRQVSVLLTDATYAKLIKITDAQEIPVSKYIRRIITAYLNHIDKKEETSNDPNLD
jgi:hypothetical protein